MVQKSSEQPSGCIQKTLVNTSSGIKLATSIELNWCLSHFLQGFIHPRWLAGSKNAINSGMTATAGATFAAFCCDSLCSYVGLTSTQRKAGRNLEIFRFFQIFHGLHVEGDFFGGGLGGDLVMFR